MAFRKIDVSYTYWLSLCSLKCREILSILLLFLNASARISEHKINNYVKIESPLCHLLNIDHVTVFMG